MKIKKLIIKGFGKIEDFELMLSPGLNIIFGENEAGKSTIQMFIKAMLYGLKGGRTSQDGILPPAARYRPWGFRDYGGIIEYQLDNEKIYRVERDFEMNRAVIYDDSFNNVSSEFNALRDKIPQFEEKHIGMSEGCFEKTVFIKQLETRLTGENSGELAERLSNISQTGFEDISGAEAEKALKEALKKCTGTGRTTTQPADLLEARLKQLQKESAEAGENREKKLANLKRIEILEKEKTLLATGKKYLEAVGFLVKLKIKLGEKLAEHSMLTLQAEELSKKKVELEAREYELLRLREKLEELSLQQQMKKKRAGKLLVGALAAIILSATAGAILEPIFATPVITACAILCLIIMYMIIINNREPKILPEAELLKQQEEEISSINESFIAEENIQRREIARVEIAAADLEAELRKFIEQTKAAFSDLEIKVGLLECESIEQVIQAGNPEWLEEMWKYESEKVNDDFLKLSIELGECNWIAAASEEEADKLQSIDEEIAVLLEKKKEMVAKGDALKIALEVLQDAAAELKRDFSPKLNEQMSSIIRQMTGNRYTDIKADDKLMPMADTPSGGGVRNARLLSGGTADQIYLALRIAAAIRLTEENESLPLIMDEVFSQYDDDRTRNTFRYFKECLSGKQVILFTCKKRETEIAAEMFERGSYLLHCL